MYTLGKQMKNFLRCKSVGGGMMQLLHDYCESEHLESPVHKKYQIDERVSFEYWLKCIGTIHLQKLEPGLGIQIGKLIRPAHVGVHAYIAQSCKNLAQFFSLSARYVSIWYNFTPLKVERYSDEMIIGWEQPAYTQAGMYVHETAVSQELMVSILWHRLCQLVGAEHVRFNWVELTVFKPTRTDIYHVFKCPVHFEASRTRISLPLDLLYIPLKQHDSVLFNILQKQADQSLECLPKEDDFVEKVNLLIIDALKHQHAFVEPIAEKLNMSSRQLQKILKDHGSSFKECLNNIRLKLAKQYLQDQNLSILDVSLLLAYAEPASFNRAFKSWTGVNPSQWRQNAVECT